MALVSPLRNIHRDAKATFLVYGEAPPIELVSTYGSFELEYAAIRRGVALFDQPHRAVIELTGPDRRDFLNRMLTQQLDSLNPWSAVRSFWLTRKGRIDADFRVVHLPERTLLEIDAHSQARAFKSLDSYLIGEDASMRDATGEIHRLGLHGPLAAELLSTVSQDVDGPSLASLNEGAACEITIDDATVIVDRQDSLGVSGFELYCKPEETEEIWLRLVNEGRPQTEDSPTSPYRQRAVGWSAINTARIEAGLPLFNVDFGTSSLPAESGALHDRVSFKKGCYLGQEIVARMDSRKASKQTLAAIKIQLDRQSKGPTVPITGEDVFPADAPDGQPIGAVTSSALSPMLGDTPICFAQLKTAYADAGNLVTISAQGKHMQGEVLDSLCFLP